jgi:hypothetical protein
VPAGWYDDPRGAQQYRYWDGVGWTDHVMPARPPARKQGSRAWIAALLLLLAFLVGLVLIEDAGDDDLKETTAWTLTAS